MCIAYVQARCYNFLYFYETIVKLEHEKYKTRIQDRKARVKDKNIAMIPYNIF